MVLKRISAVLLFCLCASLVYGQQFSFSYIGEKQQLPVDQVRRLTQDSRGFFWIGTDHGVYRYDGRNFVNLEDLVRNRKVSWSKVVNSLQIVNGSLLFIGSQGNFTVFNLRSSTLKDIKSPGNPEKPEESVYLSKVEQYKGQTFISSNTCRVYQILADSCILYKDFSRVIDSVRVPSLRDFKIDTRGNFWVATTLGLIKSGREQSLKVFFPFQETIRFKQSLDGSFIMSLYDEGLYRMHPSDTGFLKIDFTLNGEPYQVKKGDPKNNIVNLIQDKLGGIWISNLNQQLIYINPGLQTAFNYSELYYRSGATFMPEQTVLDKKGDVWFPSKKGIVHIGYPNNLFPSFLYNPNHYFDPSQSRSIKAMCQLDASRILVNSYSGFFVFDQRTGKSEPYKSFVSYKKGEYLPDAPIISSYYKDRKTGKLWLTSETTGLLELNHIDELKHEIYLDEKIPDEMRPLMLYGLFHDTINQRLILGGQRQLIYNLKSERISVQPFPATEILKFIPDTLNKAWIGTTNGLYYYTGHSFVQLLPELRDKYCYALYNDKIRKEWWIPTMDGLYVYNLTSKKLKKYSIKDGLADAYTVDIFPTSNNDGYWVLTARGISRYFRNGNRFYNYSTQDGLGSNDVNVNSFLKLQGGSCLVGGINGFNQLDFDTARVHVKKPSYQVYISNYSIYNSATNSYRKVYLSGNEKETVTLKYDERNLEFAFQAIEFDERTGQLYKYKLEGFDDWQISNQPFPVRYNNLPSGSYTFRVKHTVDGIHWIDASNPIGIVIHPPVYQQWWFILAIAVLIFGGVYFIYRYSLQNAIAMEKMRSRIASDLHDELGGLITGIALSADMMEFERPENKDAQRKKILKLSRDAIGKLSDVVWSINSGNDNFGSLRDRIQETLDNLVNTDHMSYSFDSSGIPDTLALSAKIRQNIYLICKEAINNAVKYSNGDLLEIKLTNSSGFELFIRDTGTQIQTGRLTGHGLKSIENRAKVIGCSCEIRRENGFIIIIRRVDKL